MKNNELIEANEILSRYIPAVKELLGKDITLKRMRPLMAALGNPEAKLRVLHIAGTSGKTSTAYYLAALMQTAAARIGLTVSPHIMKVSERVQINLEPLADEQFIVELKIVLEHIKSVRPQPTYFELLMALAYWEFTRQKVDYAVIETGFGGLHDGSNVAQNRDKVCVITDIGFDHTKILGSTLPAIAAQKIGIVHPGNVVFTFRQAPQIMAVFKDYCERQGAELRVVEQTIPPGLESINKLPLFQVKNWLLAFHVYKFVCKRDQLPMPDMAKVRQTMETAIPGRMEMHRRGHQTLIFDGAHNPQKMQALADSIKQRYPKQSVAVLLALKKDKDFATVLDILRTISDYCVASTFAFSQDIPMKAVPPKELLDYWTAHGGSGQALADSPQALKALLARSESVLLVTGSFYLVSQLKAEGKFT